MEVAQLKRKRARTSSSPASDDESKKRGRPRVEKQDESAADRRRTQIRMAQRAYRQRKESTLDDLRKRVSDVTNTVELMNKAFLEFSDRMTMKGMSDGQSHDIQETAQHFTNLMKAIRNPDDEMYEAMPQLKQSMSKSSSPPLHEHAQQVPPPPKNVPGWLDQTALLQAPRTTAPLDVGMGYTAFLPQNGAPNHPSYFDYGQGMSMAMDRNIPAHAQMPQHHHHMSIEQVNPNADMNRISPSLTPPVTYSFQESSFGRRLHRAGLEAGYYLLLNRSKRPATYDRIFKLSLMGRDESKLVSSLRSVLDRGPHESLDFWEAPLIHIGGAGTHYPQRDQYGNLIPRKSTYNLGLVGPQTLALLENAAQNNTSTDMTIEIAGFEGEWFDPYDVEGYLAEKGIHIDPTASFAEAEMTEWPSSPGSGSTESSGFSPTTPPPKYSTENTSAPFNAEQLRAMAMIQADLTRWDDNLSNLSFSGVGYSDAQTGSFMNFVEPGHATKMNHHEGTANWDAGRSVELMQGSVMGALNATMAPPQAGDVPELTMSHHAPAGPRKRGVIIDVSKFVKILISSCVCLGRTPGFKRRDVDRALAVASFDV